MPNTTVTITYANGSTREFVASDELEKLINESEMFSVTTMHSDMIIDEEMRVSKMYAGNPVAAMGHMIMMRANAEKILEDNASDDHIPIVIDTLTACIKLMVDEITSHQSGMSPVVEEQHTFICDHYHVNKDVCLHEFNLDNKCIGASKCEYRECTSSVDDIKPGQYRCEMCQGIFDNGWTEEESIAEAESNGFDVNDCGKVCDDCFKKTPWGKSDTTDDIQSEPRQFRKGEPLVPVDMTQMGDEGTGSDDGCS